MRLCETSRTLKNSQAWPGPVGFQNLLILPDLVPHPLAQLLPVDLGRSNLQTDLFAPFTFADRISRMDQNL